MIPKSDLFEIYCKVLINSFNIMDDDYLPVGIGLYLEASVLDHGCWPNATVVFSGKEAHVRAVAEVGSFDRVRISYTSVLAPKSRRKDELKSQYYFDCHCEECQGANPQAVKREQLKLGSVRCPKCKTDVASSSGVCSQKCDGKLPFEDHSRLTDELTSKVFEGRGGHPEPMEMCRDFYSDMDKVFSPCDTNFTRVLEHLYESHVVADEWERAYKVGCRALQAYTRLCPAYDVNVANMALKVLH